MQMHVRLKQNAVEEGCLLLVSISPCNITRTSTPHSTAAVKHDLLLLSRLLKTVLHLEGLGREVQRVCEHREWEIHRGWNGALYNFLWFTYINQVCILSESV